MSVMSSAAVVLISSLLVLLQMDLGKGYIPRLPDGISIRIPTESELVSEVAESPDSWFIFSHYLRSGWIFPMPPIVAAFLRLTGLAPCQLNPSAYKIMIALVSMFESRGSTLDARGVAAIATPLRGKTNERVILRHRQSPPLVSNLPSSERGWTLKPLVITGDIWGLSQGGIVPPSAINIDPDFSDLARQDDLSVEQCGILHQLSRSSQDARGWLRWVTTLPEDDRTEVHLAHRMFFDYRSKIFAYVDAEHPTHLIPQVLPEGSGDSINEADAAGEGQASPVTPAPPVGSSPASGSAAGHASTGKSPLPLKPSPKRAHPSGS